MRTQTHINTQTHTRATSLTQEVTQSLGEAASDLSDTFSRLRASLAVTGAARDALRGMVQEAGSHADRLRSALDAAGPQLPAV